MAGRSNDPGRCDDESGRNGMPGHGSYRTQRRKRQRVRARERDCESPLNTSMDSEASASSSPGLTREEVNRDAHPRYVANGGPIQIRANRWRGVGAGGPLAFGAFNSARGPSDEDLGVFTGGSKFLFSNVWASTGL